MSVPIASSSLAADLLALLDDGAELGASTVIVDRQAPATSRDAKPRVLVAGANFEGSIPDPFIRDGCGDVNVFEVRGLNAASKAASCEMHVMTGGPPPRRGVPVTEAIAEQRPDSTKA
jgi:hypothetical protein